MYSTEKKGKQKTLFQTAWLYRLHGNKRRPEKQRWGQDGEVGNSEITFFHGYKTTTEYRVIVAENDKDQLGRTSTTKDMKKTH